MKKITILSFMVFAFAITYIQAQTNVFYDDFQFDTNSGFTGFATNNPGSIPVVGTLIKRVGALPSEGDLGYTRPANNIGARTDVRNQTSVNLAGNNGSGNYEGITWLVTDAIDISSFTNINVTFATRSRFHEGADDDPFTVLIVKNYTDGTDPSTVTWTDVTSSIVDLTNTFGNDGAWAISGIDLTSFVADAGSDKFALAFKYEFHDVGAFSTTTNRNGTWGISDVRYVEDFSLSIQDNLISTNISIYPNPATHTLNINTDKSLKIKDISLINILGKTVYTSKDTKYTNKDTNFIDVSVLAKGVYVLKITSDDDNIFSKKVAIIN